MNRNLFFVITCAAFVAAVAAGCGRGYPAPPSERNSLILRFFNSMHSGDAAAASEQGEKLRRMDPGNEYIVKLITLQQSNAFLQRAQSELNSGNVDRALEILTEGTKTYPANRDLARQRTRVRQLRNADMLLRELHEAKNSAAMSAALTAASTGLSSNMTPKLRAYLENYKLRIAAVAREEAARTTAEPVVGNDGSAGK